MNIVIDEEVAGIIPRMTPAELEQLESSICQEGCRDALVLWSEEQVLLDGHHRLRICQEHDVPFETLGISLPDKAAAITWVVENQLGRRNLSNWERARLALKLKPIVEARARERMLSGRGADPDQESDQGSTLDVLAKKAGLSRDTLHRAQVLTEDAEPEVLEQLADGSLTINGAYEQVQDERHNRASDVSGVDVEEASPRRKRFSVCRLEKKYTALIICFMDLRDDYEAAEVLLGQDDLKAIEAMFENLVGRIRELREMLGVNEGD